MRSSLRPFDHAFGVRRSCSEERSLGGGCSVLGLIVGWPCSPLSRLISSRRRWFSAWATRRSALTSSSTLSSRLTSSRACSSTILCRSRSSSIVPLAPVERCRVYCEPLCQPSSVVATRQGMGFQPPIFEVIQNFRHSSRQGYASDLGHAANLSDNARVACGDVRCPQRALPCCEALVLLGVSGTSSMVLKGLMCGKPMRQSWHTYLTNHISHPARDIFQAFSLFLGILLKMCP